MRLRGLHDKVDKTMPHSYATTAVCHAGIQYRYRERSLLAVQWWEETGVCIFLRRSSSSRPGGKYRNIAISIFVNNRDRYFKSPIFGCWNRLKKMAISISIYITAPHTTAMATGSKAHQSARKFIEDVQNKKKHSVGVQCQPPHTEEPHKKLRLNFNHFPTK